MPFRRRSYLLVPLFIAGCSIAAGIWAGGHVSAASPADDPVSQSMKSFTAVYDAVEQNFADKVEADKAVYNGAIPGMLRTLDPHSNFFDPKALSLMREDQQGRYYGIGMTVVGRNGKVIVVAPFVGSPAYKAGLRPGDILVEIAGKSTEGFDSAKVADMLKGPRGTPVEVKVAREGSDKPITFNLIRDEISRKSVPIAFQLKPGIGYVKL